MEEDRDGYPEPEFENVEYVESTLHLPDTNDKVILKQFISKMESLPILWDCRCPLYTNSKLRLKAMEQLLSIYKQIKPNATLEDVRKKINSLRSNYRKEQRRIESSRLSAESEKDVYKPRSWVFYAMLFLNKINKPLTPSSPSKNNSLQENKNLPPSKKIKTATVAVTKQNLNLLIKPKLSSQPCDTPSQSCNTPSQSGNILPQFRTTPCQSKNTILHAYNITTKSSNTPSQSCNIGKQSCNILTTTVNSTALYWSHKLDSIKDPNQKLYAEKYINEILLEAQLGNLSGSPALHIVSSLDNQAIVLSHPSTAQNQKN